MEKIIWQYWEGDKIPFIEMCQDTVREKNKNFQIKLVNEKTIKHYLPDLREDLDKLPRVANKVDYIRFSLLNKYGGFWLDSDIVCFKSLDEIYNIFIEKKETFAATGHNGPSRPSVWLLISKKDSEISNNYLREANKILDNIIKYEDVGWNDLGNRCLKKAAADSQSLFFMPPEKFSPLTYTEWRKYFENFELVNIPSDAYTFVFFNEMLRQNNITFLKKSKQEILDSNNLISYIFKRANISAT